MEKQYRFTDPAWPEGEPLSEDCVRAHNAFIESEAGRFLGVGSDRIVYELGSGVVKIPRYAGGVEINEREVARCERGMPFPVAECEMAEQGRLVMERVVPVNPAEFGDLPHWTEFVAGHQVGRRADQLLAYDYGSEIDTRFAPWPANKV